MSGTDPGKMLVAGKITGVFGVKGWVKIHSYTEPQENFLQFGEWRLKRRGVLEPIEFDAGKRHGKGLVAHIAGVDDRTQADSYRGLEVAVASAELPTLEQGEYYWHQLQGLRVWCVAGNDRKLLGALLLFGSTNRIVTRFEVKKNRVLGWDEDGKQVADVPFTEPSWVREHYDEGRDVYRHNTT